MTEKVRIYYTKVEESMQDNIKVTDEKNILISHPEYALYSFPIGRVPHYQAVNYTPVILQKGTRFVVHPKPDSDYAWHDSIPLLIENVRILPRKDFDTLVLPEFHEKLNQYRQKSKEIESKRLKAIREANDSADQSLKLLGKEPTLEDIVALLSEKFPDDLIV